MPDMRYAVFNAQTIQSAYDSLMEHYTDIKKEDASSGKSVAWKFTENLVFALGSTSSKSDEDRDPDIENEPLPNNLEGQTDISLQE